MKRVFAFIIMLFALNITEVNAQKKVVVLDISCEAKEEYLKVSPDIFNNYREIIEDQFGANLIINEETQVDSSLLKNTDLLIILSTLSKVRLILSSIS